MAEEMSLWDTFAATPTPLDKPFDREIKKQLQSVIDALNKKYALLRSCGLEPEDWLDRESLTIAKLKDLKCLRKTAKGLLASEPRQDANGA